MTETETLLLCKTTYFDSTNFINTQQWQLIFPTISHPHWTSFILCDYWHSSTPTGLEDVSRYPQLLATLLEDPMWTEEDIKKLAGLNLLRVFSRVEEVKLIYLIVYLLFFRFYFHFRRSNCC